MGSASRDEDGMGERAVPSRLRKSDDEVVRSPLVR
jgi:hypothetical protein